jgi:DNA invertase Pin-like site-specific DNA recombinase
MVISMASKQFGKSDMMKKATPFIYARISTEEQSVQDNKEKDPLKKTTIKRQIKLIQDELKNQGLPQAKPENIYAEVAQGTKRDRKQWKAVRDAAMAHKGKAFVVVKDPSRWARSLRDAVVMWDKLMARGIPVYAVMSNLQTGSDDDLRPDEESWFSLNAIMSAKTSQIQKMKAKDARDRQYEEGALAGMGASLYPFAKADPVKVYLEHEYLLSQPKGATKLKKVVEALTMPNGMKEGSVAGMGRKINLYREKLTDDEFEEWLEFRTWMRDKSIEKEVDVWHSKTKHLPLGKKEHYWPMRAVMRMTGLYLGKPHEHQKPDYDYIANVETNFRDYLSDKDKKKRGKR